MEFRVDLTGVGIARTGTRGNDAELVEGGQGLPPGMTGGVVVAGGVVCVAEVIQIDGAAVPFAQFTVDVDGLLEVVDGFVVAPEEVIGVTEAVESMSLNTTVT